MAEAIAGHETPGREGHEHADVSARAILLFMCALGSSIVVVTGLLWLMFNQLATHQAKVDRSRFPLATAERELPLQDRLPPAPRLEGLNPESLTHSGVAGWPSLGPTQRERDQEILSRYGWVDAKGGIAQIPIDRAIELLAGKLPVRKETEKPATVPLPNRESGNVQKGEKQ